MSSQAPIDKSAIIHTPQPIGQQPRQACMDQWARKQSVEQDYKLHKRRSKMRVSLVAREAAAHMALTRFTNMQPSPSRRSDATAREEPRTTPLFGAGSPPEDLDYSLRNFATANPVDDPNVLFARIAVSEGLEPGCIPPLPQRQTTLDSEEANAGSERETRGGE